MGISVRIDSGGECINAADITISYTRETIEVVDASIGDSIFTVWVLGPTIHPEFGVVSFVGGIPGGYCGRTPGDPAVTNVLAKLIVRFKDPAVMPADALLAVVPSSKVTLNDGEGTDAALVARESSFIINDTGRPLRNEWSEELASDKIAPEAFTVEIVQDKNVLDGQYFAVFGTIDRQTGMDRYEVLEVRNRKDVESPHAPWQKTISPYVLKDQSRAQYVFVKAIDKAGNKRIAEVAPSEQARENRLIFWIVSAVALIFVLVFRIFRIIPL